MAQLVEEHYQYFKSGRTESLRNSRRRAIELGHERAHPSGQNPDKVILEKRRRFFQERLHRLPDKELDVLDIGGRIQPYRDVLGDRVNVYVAIDPQLEGLTDVVAIGESLPFCDDVFDLAICTQVLTYASDPTAMISEAHRVLKRDGALFLTTPAFFPEHHDERWRFLPGGLREMLDDWCDVEIEPEGDSVVGALRTLGVLLNEDFESRVKAFFCRKMVIPVINQISAKHKNAPENTSMTANYSVWAKK